MTDTPSAALADELLPCPFCGSADVYVERGSLSSCFVICNHCQARGPETDDENDADVDAANSGEVHYGELPARRLWNLRASGPVVAWEYEAHVEGRVSTVISKWNPVNNPDARNARPLAYANQAPAEVPTTTVEELHTSGYAEGLEEAPAATGLGELAAKVAEVRQSIGARLDHLTYAQREAAINAAWHSLEEVEQDLTALQPDTAGEGLPAKDSMAEYVEQRFPGSVAFANEPEEFAHLIELTPGQLHELITTLQPQADALREAVEEVQESASELLIWMTGDGWRPERNRLNNALSTLSKLQGGA